MIDRIDVTTQLLLVTHVVATPSLMTYGNTTASLMTSANLPAAR